MEKELILLLLVIKISVAVSQTSCTPSHDHSNGYYTCDANGNKICDLGFIGDNCQNRDPCGSPSPCHNGGTCEAHVTSSPPFTCHCPPDYSGRRCENAIPNADECLSDPCQNEGSCVDGVNNYTCTCPHGYIGPNCEKGDMDVLCKPTDPCKPGGMCLSRGDSHVFCFCLPGYTRNGTQLQCLEIDECLSYPCQNGGSCVDLVNNYTCTCAPGYTGQNCDTEVDGCEHQPCHNGGTCTRQLHGGFKCDCPPSWHGYVCQNRFIDFGITPTSTPTTTSTTQMKIATTTQKDWCAAYPCLNGANCTNDVTGRVCKCIPPYEGEDCETFNPTTTTQVASTSSTTTQVPTTWWTTSTISTTPTTTTPTTTTPTTTTPAPTTPTTTTPAPTTTTTTTTSTTTTTTATPWLSTVPYWMSLTSTTSRDFHWAYTPQDYERLVVCAGHEITIPWRYTLGEGEQVEDVTWFRVPEGGVSEDIALFGRGHFLEMPAYSGRVHWTGEGGIVVSGATVGDSGRYTVVVTVVSPSKNSFSKYQRTVLVQVAEPPQTYDGQLHVSQSGQAVKNNVTGEWSIQLTCGHFYTRGHPHVDVEWTFPDGHYLHTSNYSDGEFTLLLPSPPTGGNYSCRLLHDPAASCLPYYSPLLEVASVEVNEVKAGFSILSAEQGEVRHQLQELQEENRLLRQDIQSCGCLQNSTGRP